MSLPKIVYAILKRVHIPPRLHWQLARLYNTHFLLGVAGIITNEAGELLLFRHTYRNRHPWGTPGGWMERSESPLAALEREVYEESALIIKAERMLLLGTTPDRPKLEFVVGGRVIGGDFRPSREVSEYGWFARDKLPPLAAFHHHILRTLDATPPGELGWYEAPWLIAHPD